MISEHLALQATAQPLLPAELLDVSTMPKAKGSVQAHEGSYSDAWKCVELGVALGYANQSTQCQAQFATAKTLLDQLLYYDGYNAPAQTLATATYTGAVALRAFLPVFELRAHRTIAQDDTLFHTFESITSQLQQLTSQQIIKNRGHVIETELLALGCIAGVVLHPASPREEKNTDTLKKYSHDMYTLITQPYLKKNPWQLKSTKSKTNHDNRYDPSVKMVYFKEDILQPCGIPATDTLLPYLLQRSTKTTRLVEVLQSLS